MKLSACPEDAAIIQQVLDLLTESVVVVDRDGRIDFVNEAFASALGYRADELVGRLYLELLDEESMNTAMEGLERALRVPVTPPTTVTVKTRSGRCLAMTFEGMGIRTAERGLVGVCCVAHDLPPATQD
ncbi:MAG: PAS domain-containing protein [Deltaproteobacteria bacterium]|nr:PAS domain-containing protein [Deltaproteobacteria bacterium]